MSEPTTEAGKALVAAMFGDTWDMPDDPGGAIAAIEAEAAAQERERIELAAGLDRDEAEWKQAIVDWLGPQRMSIQPFGAERHYGRIGVVVAAIIRAALAQRAPERSEALNVERLREAVYNTAVGPDDCKTWGRIADIAAEYARLAEQGEQG